MRCIAKLLALLLSFAVNPALAEPLPGSDDLALQRVAAQWLAQDDPEDAMARIGALGLNGNIAAQHLANQIFLRGLTEAQRALSREDRMALFLGDASPQTPFSLFRIDRDAFPALAARRDMSLNSSVSVFLEAAEAALLAGMDSSVESAVSYRLANLGEIEIAEFALAHFTPDDGIVFEVWHFISLAAYGAEHGMESRYAQLAPLWEGGQRAAFEAALAENRWAAVNLAISGNGVPLIPATRQADLEPLMQLRIQSLVRDGDVHLPPDLDVLDAFGTVLLARARQTPNLLPTSNACALVCPQAQTICVASIVLSVMHRPLWGYEPGIPRNAYVASDRAARDLLMDLPRRMELRARTWPLPSCIAATE